MTMTTQTTTTTPTEAIRTMARTRQRGAARFVAFGTALGAAALTPSAARADAQTHAAEVGRAQAEMTRTLGFVPEFTKPIPANLLPGVWRQVRDFEISPNTALAPKTKGMIGLAIAAQMPSRLTTWSYTKCARASGATEAEVKEAVAVAALVRHWSTFFNGVQLDETKFRAEIGKLRDNLTKAMASGSPPPAPLPIVDASSVLKDAEQSFGFVPEFVKRYPAEALPGAWMAFRAVEMDPQTALSGKVKSLVSLAVASQIPCRYCVIADSEFAKLEGATDREITEAIAMAAMARQHITLVEGLQIDERAYRRDWERLTSPRHAQRSGSGKAAGAGKVASRTAAGGE